MGIVISILLTVLAIIGIWEKDQPKYFGIGGEVSEKVKLHEYVQIIRNNNPMQRLMVAGAGCKLALSIATNTTVLCMLYGCMMGSYDGLYLHDGAGLRLQRALLPAHRPHQPEGGPEGQPDEVRQRGIHLLHRRAGAAAALGPQRRLHPVHYG